MTSYLIFRSYIFPRAYPISIFQVMKVDLCCLPIPRNFYPASEYNPPGIFSDRLCHLYFNHWNLLTLIKPPLRATMGLGFSGMVYINFFFHYIMIITSHGIILSIADLIEPSIDFLFISCILRIHSLRICMSDTRH